MITQRPPPGVCIFSCSRTDRTLFNDRHISGVIKSPSAPSKENDENINGEKQGSYV